MVGAQTDPTASDGIPLHCRKRKTSSKKFYEQTKFTYSICGRFTVKATWAELVAMYRLTMDVPPHNLRPRCNVCPTDPMDVLTERDGKRELVTMLGPVPWWWSKPLKELRMATFNARAETVETKPVFRDVFEAD